MQPMDGYLNRINDVVQFSVDRNTLFTAKTILQIVHPAIIASGKYVDACKEWLHKDQAQKKWANFKIFLAR